MPSPLTDMKVPIDDRATHVLLRTAMTPVIEKQHRADGMPDAQIMLGKLGAF